MRACLRRRHWIPACAGMTEGGGVMGEAEPRFERMLVGSCYPCRPGTGGHAAVADVQRNLQRWPRFVQVDVDGYFPSVDHEVVKTSQHFVNAYLDAADRFLLEYAGVRAYVRRMDGIVWWCEDQASLDELGEFLVQARHRVPLSFRRKPESRGRLASQRAGGGSIGGTASRVCSWTPAFAGVTVEGGAPRRAWRLLERQRQEGALCLPELERPWQPLEQPGFSLFPELDEPRAGARNMDQAYRPVRQRIGGKLQGARGAGRCGGGCSVPKAPRAAAFLPPQP